MWSVKDVNDQVKYCPLMLVLDREEDTFGMQDDLISSGFTQNDAHNLHTSLLSFWHK